MNNCVILYGQIRTLDKTIYSIKRLFKEILKYDIYVIINLNLDDNKNDWEKKITDNLDPTLLHFVYDNQIETSHFINLNETSIKNFKTSIISFDEYKKLEYKDTYYTINDIKNYNLKIEDKVNDINIINNYPYNMYIEDILVYIVFSKIPKDKYEKVFLIRTDCAWFENLKSKNENVYIKDVGFREKTALKNEYNEKIINYNFEELVDKIMNSQYNVLGNYFYHDKLNLKIPNAHARFFYYNDLKKIFNTFGNINDVLKIFEKYPILYPTWEGELQQKRIYEYLDLKFETDFILCDYCILIREK
jgi:hypothetical protein